MRERVRGNSFAVYKLVAVDGFAKCAICHVSQYDKKTGKLLKFVVDHIDGNYKNDTRKNLRQVCLDCDANLPTTNRRGNARNNATQSIPRDIASYNFIQGMIDAGMSFGQMEKHVNRKHTAKQFEFFALRYGLYLRYARITHKRGGRGRRK